jgi:polyisoprenoid-binding protein YceI
VHLNAQLTVAGVRKPLQFVATVVDPSADEVTLQAEVEIDKREFGMTANPE